MPKHLYRPVGDLVGKDATKHPCVVFVSEHPPKQRNSGRYIVRLAEQPFNLPHQPGNLGVQDVCRHRVPIRGGLNHKRGHVLEGRPVLIHPVDEGGPFVNVILLGDAGTKRGVGPSVEGLRDGPQARLSHGVPAARIPQKVPPPSNPVGRPRPRPGKHDRASARNHHKPTLRVEGRVQGNTGVMHNLYGDRPRVVPEFATKPIGERLLFVGATGPGHPRTDRQVVDGPLGPNSLLHQAGQHLDRPVHPYSLRVCGRPMPVDSFRKGLAFGEQQRLGTAGIESGEEVICRHRDRAGVENGVRDACGCFAHSRRLTNGFATARVSIGTGGQNWNASPEDGSGSTPPFPQWAARIGAHGTQRPDRDRFQAKKRPWRAAPSRRTATAARTRSEKDHCFGAGPGSSGRGGPFSAR